MAKTYQSRGFVLKTVSNDVLQFALDFCSGVPGSRWAYAQHVPAPPKVPHWHFVGLFEDRVYWKSVFDFAMSNDPCSSTDTCKKPRKAVRYLLHLDAPDKHPVPRESLITGGMWGPDELEDWLAATSVASSLVDTCLRLWRDGLTPLDALSRLVSFGFEPYQISASLQAYSRLCEFWLKHAPNALAGGMGADSPHQGIHGAPPPNGEESKDSDIQGQKTARKSAIAEQAKFGLSRPDKTQVCDDSHATSDHPSISVESSKIALCQTQANLSGAVIDDVQAVFGPNVVFVPFRDLSSRRVSPTVRVNS